MMRFASAVRAVLLTVIVVTSVPHGSGEASDSGRFTSHRYTNAKGTLTYKLYTPPATGARPRNLVVVLHGGGESADTAAARSRWNSVARRFRFVVAYPQQNEAYDASRIWDWPGATKDGRRDREASLIAGITRTVTTQQRLDPRRVVVMGMSAGAGMASAMAVAYPDLYSGLGLEAGCPFDNAGCAGSSVTAEQSAAAVVRAMGRYRRPLPVFNQYGGADPIAVGVSSNQVVPSWLTVADLLDNGRDDGSVSRSPARSTTMTPPLPNKPYAVNEFRDSRGCARAQDWVVHGQSHAWAGGSETDPNDTGSDALAPDVTTAMYRFFTDPATLGRSPRCGVR